MPQHLVVVEGAHDAAFFGKLLSRQNFSLVQNLAAVPEFWQPLIPNKYPVDPSGRLDRIITFPDIHISADGHTTIAVSVAGGSDANLISTLRAALEIKSVQDFTTVTLVADTDFQTTEANRFQALRQRLITLNTEAQAEGQAGFPLSLPAAVGQLAAGAPHVGVYLWPGSGQQGTLEQVLLDCAQATHPILHAEAQIFWDAVDAQYAPGAAQFAAARTPSGKLKTICGGIASMLKPGASLAVSIRQSQWLPHAAGFPPAAQMASDYLDSVLAVT